MTVITTYRLVYLAKSIILFVLSVDIYFDGKSPVVTLLFTTSVLVQLCYGVVRICNISCLFIFLKMLIVVDSLKWYFLIWRVNI